MDKYSLKYFTLLMVKFTCIKNKSQLQTKQVLSIKLKNRIKYIATAIVINNFFKWKRVSSLYFRGILLNLTSQHENRKQYLIQREDRLFMIIEKDVSRGNDSREGCVDMHWQIELIPEHPASKHFLKCCCTSYTDVTFFYLY